MYSSNLDSFYNISNSTSCQNFKEFAFNEISNCNYRVGLLTFFLAAPLFTTWACILAVCIKNCFNLNKPSKNRNHITANGPIYTSTKKTPKQNNKSLHSSMVLEEIDQQPLSNDQQKNNINYSSADSLPGTAISLHSTQDLFKTHSTDYINRTNT